MLNFEPNDIKSNKIFDSKFTLVWNWTFTDTGPYIIWVSIHRDQRAYMLVHLNTTLRHAASTISRIPAINKLFHQAGARSFCILPHHQSARSLNLLGKRTDTMPASQHTSAPTPFTTFQFYLSNCVQYTIQNFNSFHHARLRHKWHWKCTKCYTLFTQQTLPNLFQPFHLYFSSKGAEMKVPSDADPGLSKVLSSQPKVGQTADLYALPVVRNCTFLSSALPVLSTLSFPNLLPLTILQLFLFQPNMFEKNSMKSYFYSYIMSAQFIPCV